MLENFNEDERKNPMTQFSDFHTGWSIEDFLHFVWKFKRFNTKELQTTKKETITLLSLGKHNTNSGPDFHQAKIKIGQTTWAGDIEIHARSSDWNKHKHSSNKAFDTVVLHVVYEYDLDSDVLNSSNNSIPTLELKGKIPKVLFEQYKKWIENEEFIPCQGQFSQLDNAIISSWLERLYIERLERKHQEISIILKQSKNNWDQTFHIILLQSFGTKVNKDAFRQVAEYLPFGILLKHSDSIEEMEALLFGVAGMLEGNIFTDDYGKKLQIEFSHLKKKHHLNSLSPKQVRFSRMRPANFPTLRLSQFAALIHKHKRIFAKSIETQSLETLKSIFLLTVSNYWDTHYQFDQSSHKRKKKISQTFIDHILINCVIPIRYAYFKHTDDRLLLEKTIELSTQIQAEKNTITKEFSKHGVDLKDARISQALLELKNKYCEPKKCLSCTIGISLLK